MFGANGNLTRRRKGWAAACLVLLMLNGSFAWAADVVPNGIFNTDLSGWTPTILQSNGTIAWDNTVYGLNPGSMRFRTNTGRNLTFEAENVTTLSSSINSGDTVTLSFYWFKTAVVRGGFKVLDAEAAVVEAKRRVTQR